MMSTLLVILCFFAPLCTAQGVDMGLLKAGAGFLGSYGRGLLSNEETGTAFKEGILDLKLDKQDTQIEVVKQALQEQYESFDLFNEKAHHRALQASFGIDSLTLYDGFSFPSQELYRDKVSVNIARLACSTSTVSEISLPRVQPLPDSPSMQHEWAFDPSTIEFAELEQKRDLVQVEYYHLSRNLKDGELCYITQVRDIWSLPKIETGNAFSRIFENKERAELVADLTNAVKLMDMAVPGGMAKALLTKLEGLVTKPALLNEVSLYEVVDLARYVVAGEEGGSEGEVLREKMKVLEAKLERNRPMVLKRNVLCLYSRKSMCKGNGWSYPMAPTQ
jgi:hypothetical protein